MDIKMTARAPWADRKAPVLARIIALSRKPYWEGWRKTSIRAPYGEVSFGSALFALSLGSHGRPHIHVAVPGIQVFFRLPHWGWLHRITGGPNAIEGKRYGFSWWFGNDWQGDIHFNWGSRYKIVSMPWGWNKRRDDYRREYLAVDGNWYNHRQFPYEWVDEASRGPEAYSESHPYPYLTRYGQFQGDITATIHRERTHMLYRVLGVPVKRKTIHTIDVTFDKEVGSERGSWKGGTVGCSYDMKPGETPEATLTRMRRERNFDR